MDDWVDRLLGPGLELARLVPGFAARPEQLRLAHAVSAALADRAHLVSEAGTGTGKTFAYLVPALSSGLKVIVSTGTRNLQDQLFHRDLPVLRRAIPGAGRVALLKGRANYLCLQRLEQALADAGSLTARDQVDLRRVADWSGRTRSGDLAQVAGLPEHSAVLPLVTSTVDNCLGSACPQFEKCWVLEARREAVAADLVVVNHHLLMADMVLRDEGFGELLPGADAVIVDEAHQLPEVARGFFGTSLGSRQLLDLSHDLMSTMTQEAADQPALRDLALAIETASRELRLAFGRGDGRGALADCSAEVDSAFAGLQSRLDTLRQALEAVSERGVGLENGLRRTEQTVASVAGFRAALAGEASDRLGWFEVRGQGLMLHLSPLEIAEPFRSRLAARTTAWVFTSATLAVGEDFSHFNRQLGLEDVRELALGSPFDYANQALLYLPRLAREPRDAGYTAELLAAVLPLIESLDGRTFLLFTSYRALRQGADWLRNETHFSLQVQGEAPKAELLGAFTSGAGNVLLGTSSFWEGVDVRGAALSCVVIDKLPFAAPDDPILEARLKQLRAEGGEPFRDLQIPEAVLQLKQGAGRLVRDVQDRGLLVLGDPRLTSKGYGRTFLKALPPMPRTREPAAALQFCEALARNFDA